MMRRITRFIQSLHRILGTMLSVLFLVWFLSGFVMIYHTFPRVSAQDKLARMDYLTPGLPSIGELSSRLPEGEKITSLTLNRYLGQTVFHIRTNKENYDLPADSAVSLPSIDRTRILEVASHWCGAPVAQIDTLHKLDQWIPFGYLKKEFPIYKFLFADAARHQLYISSVTGEVLQYTDSKSRLWAWLGAIPHWVYFTRLRQDASLWIDTVIWLSGIGCVMCIAGICWGIRDVRIARKKKKTLTPYKKKWYRWHHLTGFVFGLFVLTFTFSGMMSLAEVPGWLSRPRSEVNARKVFHQKTRIPSDYTLDYRRVIAAYPNTIRQLVWGSFNDYPFYSLQTDSDKPLIIDASTSEIRPLALTEDYVLRSITQVHGTEGDINIHLLNAYDSYYISRKRNLDLPVWKVSVEDVDNSTYYINPATGSYRYINNTSRWRHWMYPALHSFNIPGLANNPVLWNIVMWTTMLGGTVVSLTGVILGCRYLLRKLKRFIRYLRG